MNENHIEEWHYYKRGIISTKADCEKVEMNKLIVKDLFKHFGGLYIRYVSDFDMSQEGPFYSVIKDGKMTIETLPSKTRNMVRRCLNNCQIQLVDCKDIIIDGGYLIYLSETRRYERNGYPAVVKSEEKWTNGILESSARGEEYWGVYKDGQLIAYGIVNPKHKEAGLVTWKCDYEKYKELYPSYGLVYSITKHYLELEDIDYVSDGQRTLTGHSRVQDFLESKFGYRKAYLKLNVVFKWYVKLPLMLLAPFENAIKNINLLSLIRLYKWSR